MQPTRRSNALIPLFFCLAFLALATALVLAGVASGAGPEPGDELGPGAMRGARPAAAPERAAGSSCHARTHSYRKTSLGIHQWTVGTRAEWCWRGRKVVSVRHSPVVETGTNWRLISKRASVGRDGRGRVIRARFHLRLRYPYLEQNCRPRLVIRLEPGGASRHGIDVGC